MKLRLLLWGLGWLLRRTFRRDQAFREQLATPLNFAVMAERENIARTYQMNTQAVTSEKGLQVQPDLVLRFPDAHLAYKTLTSADRNAFMRAIQEKQVVIEGDHRELFRLQKLMAHLKV